VSWFAVTGRPAAVQFARQKEGETPDFIPSRLFIYYNERDIEGTVDQDSGAQIRDGMKAVSKLGVCPETSSPSQPYDWPYDIKKFTQSPPPSGYEFGVAHQITSYRRIPQVVPERAAIGELDDCGPRLGGAEEPCVPPGRAGSLRRRIEGIAVQPADRGAVRDDVPAVPRRARLAEGDRELRRDREVCLGLVRRLVELHRRSFGARRRRPYWRHSARNRHRRGKQRRDPRHHGARAPQRHRQDHSGREFPELRTARRRDT